MQDKRQNRTMLAFEITREMRELIRIHALKRHMTMRAWVSAVIGEALRREQEYEK